MPGLRCLPSFCLVMAVLLLCPVRPAGAGEADRIRADVADALSYAFAGANDEAVLTYAAIEVAGDAAPYDVTVRRVQFAPQHASEGVVVGDIGFELAPLDDGLYRVSELRLPNSIAEAYDDGGRDLRLYFGDALLAGVWSQPFHAFLSLDATFRDIAMQGGDGGEWLSAAQLTLRTSRVAAGPGRWDQRSDLAIRGLRFEGRNQAFSVGSIDACLRLPRADLQALRTLWRMVTRSPDPVSPAPIAAAAPTEPPAIDVAADCASFDIAAAPPSDAGLSDQPPGSRPPAAAPTPEPFALPDLMAGLSGAPIIVGDLAARLKVQDFYLFEAGEIWRFDGGAIGLDLAGADGMAARLGFSLQLGNLRGIPAPDFRVYDEDEKRQRLIAGTVPRDVAIDLLFDDLPFTALWSAFVESQKLAPDPAAEEKALAMLAHAAFGLVTRAGSSLLLSGWRIASLTNELVLDGAIRGDATNPMGATGGLDIRITGLDDLISLLRANLDEPADVMALGLLVAIGARQTDPAGKVVDSYAFSVDDTGKLLLNGKDFMPLIELMQR